MNKTVLINGITGQDGSYMSEFLLAKGYRVIGAVRDLDAAKSKWEKYLISQVELVQWNMLDQDSIATVLKEFKPNEFYNFAAYSSGSGMYDEAAAIGMVNGIAVTYMLEAINKVDKKIRFCQASSREVFGDATESPQHEATKISPRSPYGAAKSYADQMIDIYRKRYGLFLCSAILYNHESPRRGLEFVTRKITNEAVKIKIGQSEYLYLGNLDAQRDWGYAGDTVEAMWRMLQHHKADNYIVATGMPHSVRDFCEQTFSYLGLDYHEYVKSDESEFRPMEQAILVGKTDKIKKELNWKIKTSFEELIKMMVDADMKLLSEGHNIRGRL